MPARGWRRERKPHGGQRKVRLSLTTKDIALIFRVKEDTVRQWLSKKRDTLQFTGDPATDFLVLANLAKEKGLLDV